MERAGGGEGKLAISRITDYLLFGTVPLVICFERARWCGCVCVEGLGSLDIALQFSLCVPRSYSRMHKGREECLNSSDGLVTSSKGGSLVLLLHLALCNDAYRRARAPLFRLGPERKAAESCCRLEGERAREYGAMISLRCCQRGNGTATLLVVVVLLLLLLLESVTLV